LPTTAVAFVPFAFHVLDFANQKACTGLIVTTNGLANASQWLTFATNGLAKASHGLVFVTNGLANAFRELTGAAIGQPKTSIRLVRVPLLFA